MKLRFFFLAVALLATRAVQPQTRAECEAQTIHDAVCDPNIDTLELIEMYEANEDQIKKEKGGWTQKQFLHYWIQAKAAQAASTMSTREIATSILWLEMGKTHTGSDVPENWTEEIRDAYIRGFAQELFENRAAEVALIIDLADRISNKGEAQEAEGDSSASTNDEPSGFWDSFQRGIRSGLARRRCFHERRNGKTEYVCRY